MTYTLVTDTQPRTNPTVNKRTLPIELDRKLLKYNNEYDFITIENNILTITRKIGLTRFGVPYILDNPIVTTLTGYSIELFEGTNYIYIIEDETINLKVTYMLNNEMNDHYATKVELSSSISQTAEEILSEVSANYATSEELSSSISQTAEELNIEIAKKTNKTEIITTINASAEGILINTNKLNINGVITAINNNTSTNINGDKVKSGSLESNNYVANVRGTKIDLTNGTIDTKNFKLDQEGNAVMASSTLTNGILKIGSKVVAGTNGLLTILQFQSNGSYPLGWYSEGQDINGNWSWQKMALEIPYAIPENFTILNAYVKLFHVPCYSKVATGTANGIVYNNYWSYSRNIKLYKIQTSSYIERLGMIGVPDFGSTNVSEVYKNSTSTNAFGANGFTANVANSTTHNSQTATSEEISSSFQTGENGMLVLKTTQSNPSSYVDGVEKTGQGYATLNIVGYYKI